MENRELIWQHCCNNFNFLMVRLALKAPKQNFSELMLQNVAKVTTLDFKIISKLTGINRDRFLNGADAPALRSNFEPIGSVSLMGETPFGRAASL